MACQPQSKFAKAYREGMNKKYYWEYTLEDCLDICAKASRIASLVYYNCYKPVNYIFQKILGLIHS